MEEKIKIAICDDEETYMEKMYEYIKAAEKVHGTEFEVTFANSGFELIDYCRDNPVDAVFLDIEMHDIDGFKTAEKLEDMNSEILIVFVSQREALVFSSYKYTHLWFVPKSQLDFMEDAMDKIVEAVKKRRNDKKEIILQIKNEPIRFDFCQINYIITSGHYLMVHEQSSDKTKSYRGKISDIAELENQWFVRCHNRYLVNCRMIKSVEDGFFLMNDGTQIPISRAYAKEAKNKFYNYLRSMI